MENKDFILITENVNKKFKNKKALDDFNLKLEKGKVLGLLGPNGTGKTTFLKSIMGLVKIDSGLITINGKKPSYKSREFISYLPDSNYLFEGFTVKECVNIFKSFFKDFNQNKLNQLLKKMNIDINMRVSNMSKGYVERLNVALVMSRDAKLFVLDEPIAGVDPLARDMIIDAIIENIGDATMIVTTQLIDELQKLFDEVCYMDDGKIILQGNTDDLIEKKGKMLEDIYKELYI